MSLFHKRLRQLNITNNSWLQAFAETLQAANESPRTGGCNPQTEIYNLKFFAGVLAQLEERLNGIEYRSHLAGLRRRRKPRSAADIRFAAATAPALAAPFAEHSGEDLTMNYADGSDGNVPLFQTDERRRRAVFIARDEKAPSSPRSGMFP